MHVRQTKIYIDVDDVPVTGISASERVSVLVSATVNDGLAGNTLVSFRRLRPTRACCLLTVPDFQVSPRSCGLGVMVCCQEP